MQVFIKSKLLIAAITITTLSFFLASAVQAEDGSNTTRPSKPPRVEELRLKQEKMASKATEMKHKMDERQTKLASKSAELDKKRDQLASRAADMASKSAQRWEDRCKMINQRTSTKLTRYETNKTKHVENYMQAKKRLQDVITRLKTQGYDVTKLEADLTQLDTLIKKASDDYAAFIASLKTTGNFTCGKSEGAFADALKASQDKLQTARTSLLAVRTYYKDTVRPDIQAIKAQRPSRSPRASGSARPSTSPVATATAAPSASAQ